MLRGVWTSCSAARTHCSRLELSQCGSSVCSRMGFQYYIMLLHGSGSYLTLPCNPHVHLLPGAMGTPLHNLCLGFLACLAAGSARMQDEAACHRIHMHVQACKTLCKQSCHDLQVPTMFLTSLRMHKDNTVQPLVLRRNTPSLKLCSHIQVTLCPPWILLHLCMLSMEVAGAMLNNFERPFWPLSLTTS